MQALLSPTADSLTAPTSKEMGRRALVTALGFALYGFTIGYWRSPVMGVFVAVKMPLLIAFTLGCNSLLNGLLGILLGSSLGFRQSLHALLSAFAISALILGAVAPVTFFLAVNIPSADSPQAVSAHSAYLLTHTLMIGMAGLIGVVRLGKLLDSYSSSKIIARSTLAAWIAGNAFLGMQFSWILRPFFGSPQLEVALLRDSPMKGSFIEAVWGSLDRLLGGVPVVTWVGILGGGAITLILIYQIKTEPKKRRT